MIIVRCRGLKTFFTSFTCPSIDWDMWTMFSCNMNIHIWFHPTRMTTVWTIQQWLSLYTRMYLFHMLLKTTLLNKRLCTSRNTAFIIENPGMFFEMVKHSVLPRCNFVTMRTCKESSIVPLIC